MLHVVILCIFPISKCSSNGFVDASLYYLFCCLLCKGLFPMLNRVLDLSTKINVYNCLKSLINTGITCTTFSNVFCSEYAYTSSIAVSSNPEDAFLFLFEKTNELNFIVYWISYCIWEGKSCVLLRCSILVVFGSYK